MEWNGDDPAWDERSHDRPRALIVEDEPAVSAFLVHLTEMAGFAVKVAGDGPDALDMLETFLPDVMLLDIMLPSLDGLSVLRAFRERVRTRDRPVIVITALADDRNVWEAWRAGCDYHLTKPFDPKELLDALRRLVPAAAGRSAV